MTRTRRKRALLLSPMLPGAGFWGRYQRYSLLGRAIAGFADIDVLAFLHGSPGLDPKDVESRASEEWGARVRLHTCPATSVDPSRWRRWLLSPLDFRRQPALQIAGGAAQITALEKRLELDAPDLVVAFGMEMMLPLLALRGTLPPIHLDFDDVPHIKRWRERRLTDSLLRRNLLASQIPGLLWAERRAASAARRSYVCSDLDRDYLTRRWRLPRVEVFPNAVSIPEALPLAEEQSLLFIGQMEYPPNAAAAKFLMWKVWPRVLEKLPGARLRIAGPSPEVLLRDLPTPPPGVELTGIVDDLRSLYATTRVACAPMHVGSGTRVKILEAAAFGRPVVSTRVGAEGLDMKDGRDLLLRDDAPAFAEACCRLLSSPDESRRLGDAGRRRVAELYETSAVLERLRAHLDS